MPVSQYPTPYNPLHTSEPNGPGDLGSYQCGFKWQALPDEYPSLAVTVMMDGGATYGTDTTHIVKRWRLTYTGLTEAIAAILDSHRAEAKDRLLGFDFRDRRTDVLWSDVHYESYEYPEHDFLDAQSRVITLIKRPA